MNTYLHPTSKLHHGRELDVFQADRYFSDNIGSISFRSEAEEHNEDGCKRVARRSLDFPLGWHAPIPHPRGKRAAKKIKQPMSPGKRIASILSSFLHHSGFRRKTPATDVVLTCSEKGRHSYHGKPIRPPCSRLDQVRDEPYEAVARRHGAVCRFLERDEIWGEDGKGVGKWTLNKWSGGLLVDESLKDVGTCGDMARRSNEEDYGEESDSSSDLFDLPDYCLMGGNEGAFDSLRC